MHTVLKFRYNLAFAPSLELQSSAELAVKAGHCFRSGLKTGMAYYATRGLAHGNQTWSYLGLRPAGPMEVRVGSRQQVLTNHARLQDWVFYRAVPSQPNKESRDAQHRKPTHTSGLLVPHSVTHSTENTHCESTLD